MKSAHAKIIVASIAVNLAFTSFSSVAKAQQWGTGQWGGMQGCQGGFGPASGATSESDEIRELKRAQAELLQQKKEVAKDIRELEREKERLAGAINEALVPNWAGIFLSHMDQNRNCCINPPEGSGRVEQEPADDNADQIPPEPRVPRAPRPKPNNSSKSMSMNEEEVSDRAPASAQADPFGRDMDEGGGGGGGGQYGGGAPQTMCYPDERPYSMRKFKNFACQPDGSINPGVCTSPGLFQKGGLKSSEASACSRAITRYRKTVLELDKLERLKAQIASDLDDNKMQLRESLREGRSEGVCTTCGPGGGRGPGGPVRAEGGTNWGNVLSTMAPALLGVAVGGGLEYLNYSQNKSNNQNLNKLGWPTQPYQFGQYMYPFASMGIYGSVMSGVNQGFGCSPGIGGGGAAMGPFGMGGPMGMSPYANMGGAFGYPQGMMPGFPQMGGGMFNPGFGPWGMAGPWGNGGGGMGGFPGMGGGFPGMGGMPGMNIGMGFGGGMPGMGGGIGGFPGMGGGFPGMGGMPGMGLGMNAGFGFGMPGQGLAGMGGYPGLGGMPGFGGGMPGIGGLPGMGSPFGGIGGPGGMPYSPMTPFGGGSPFGGSPMGGMPGYGASPFGMPGFSSPYGMPGMDTQRQYYNNMVGRQIQGQQLYSKYSSLMYEINAFNSGVSALSSPGLGFGGSIGGYNYGAGLNLGISGGLNYNSSTLGGGTPWLSGGQTPGTYAPYGTGRSR